MASTQVEYIKNHIQYVICCLAASSEDPLEHILTCKHVLSLLLVEWHDDALQRLFLVKGSFKDQVVMSIFVFRLYWFTMICVILLTMLFLRTGFHAYSPTQPCP